MHGETVENVGTRRNSEVDRPEPSPTTREKLLADDWVVQVPRSVVLDNRLGPLLVAIAASAWSARGPAWPVDQDQDRGAAAAPPGGWAAMIQSSRSSWPKWLDAAVRDGLVVETVGTDESGCGHDLLVAKLQIEPGSQFARLPLAVMFDRSITPTARRAYAALALYRQPSGEASASVERLAAITGVNRRHIQRSLRELERHFAIVRMPTAARKPNRWMMVEVKVAAPDVQNESRPCPKSAAHVSNIRPAVVQNVPPYQELSQESVQESLSSAREGAREADDDDGLDNDADRNWRLFGRRNLSGLTPDTWCHYLDLVSRWRESEDKFYIIRSARRERERMAAA